MRCHATNSHGLRSRSWSHILVVTAGSPLLELLAEPRARGSAHAMALVRHPSACVLALNGFMRSALTRWPLLTEQRAVPLVSASTALRATCLTRTVQVDAAL